LIQITKHKLQKLPRRIGRPIMAVVAADVGHTKY
jgi:hypothetical protein